MKDEVVALGVGERGCIDVGVEKCVLSASGGNPEKIEAKSRTIIRRQTVKSEQLFFVSL